MRRLRSPRGETTIVGREALYEPAAPPLARIEDWDGVDNLGWNDFELALLSGRIFDCHGCSETAWDESGPSISGLITSPIDYAGTSSPVDLCLSMY